MNKFIFNVIYICGCFTVFCQELPDLTETSLEEIDVIPSDDAIIDCIVRNANNFTILWKFIPNSKSEPKLLSANKVIISDDKRLSVIHNEDKDRWALRIRQAESSDSGLYTCEVNSVPKVSVARVLTVDYPKTFNVLKNYTKSTLEKVSHNFTDCCVKEGIPSVCNGFCSFNGLVTETPKAHIFAICYNYMSQLMRCLTDGRNHIPCCEKQNIPRLCQPSCAGKYTLSTALEHVICLEYTTPTLACIAEGIEILPPPPKDITAESTSPSQITVKWEKNPESLQKLIESYELNVTELHSFDPINWSLNKKDKLPKEMDALVGKTNSYQIFANVTQYIINNLKQSTMYEIVMKAINKFGTSVVTTELRVVTLSHQIMTTEKDMKKPISPLAFNKTDTNAPNLRKCCVENGMKSDQCLNVMCDATKVEEATAIDISYCAQYANITFKCLLSDVDMSDCCEERGVSQFCSHFCTGKLSKTDFRHFVCLQHIPAYSSCLLESKGVLTSEPRNVLITSTHQDWALLKWLPPTKLSETVTKYHIHIRELDTDSEDGYMIDIATRSPFLIDNLKPGNSYEVYLTAFNKYGISRGSSRVMFKTKTPKANEEVELQQSDSSAGYNETACCARAGIPDICLPLCSYHMKINDGLHLGPLCADHRTIRTMVRCLAGGRDHRPCCERRGVKNECLDICVGAINQSPFLIGSKCSKISGKILQCMVEGADVLPGIPQDFHSTLVTKNSVHLQWNSSSDDIRSGEHVSYQLRYSIIDSEIPPHPYEDKYSIHINISDTKTILSDLKPSTRYSIYVVSVNSYGYSMPSLVLIINTLADNDESDKTDVIKSQLGAPHGLEVIHQTTDSLSFKWLPPYYIPPDVSLLYEVYYKKIPINPSEQPLNWTVVETYGNLIDINMLTFNTQYALAVKAKTESGLISGLSEIMLTWTEPATPIVLSPPQLEPKGPIIEGSMMVVRCDATGSPIPTISVYVNGIPVKTEETRHIFYRLDYVQRNLTAISCQASNAQTDSNHTIFPAQSHVEVRVRFAPSIKIDKKLNIAGKYGSTQLRCEFSGNPEPKIQFFRDLRNQAEIKSGTNTQITVIPHSTKSSTWISTLTLNRVTESDAGHYLCIAQNEYGRETAVINLKVEEHKVTNRNSSVCCQEQGVSDQCQTVCKFEIDFDSIFNKPQCFSELDKYMYCAADGSDHRDCCLRRDVSRECLHWCAGYKVSKPSLCLLSSVRDIVSCFKEGNALLPSAPKNVKVSELFTDNRLIISWDKPDKNAEAVQWYNVYWKQVGSKDLDSDRTDQLGYELHNLDPYETYEFLVKSSNFYGTSALADPLVINIRKLRNENEALRQSMLKILIGSFLTIIIMIIIAVVGYYVFKNKDLLTKFRSTNSGFGVSFENQGYINNADNLQLQDNFNNNHITTDANNNQNHRPIVEIRMH